MNFKRIDSLLASRMKRRQKVPNVPKITVTSCSDNSKANDEMMEEMVRRAERAEMNINKGEWKETTGIDFSVSPTEMHLLKVINGKTRTVSVIYAKLTIKTPDWRPWYCSGALVSLLLTLNKIRLLFGRFHCWLWTSKCCLCLCANKNH